MKSLTRTACAIVVAASGCGQSDGSSASSAAGSTATPTEIAALDGVVTSVDQLAEGFWQPIRADGADVDLTEGDYWEFLTRDGELVIVGFDGCNGFGTSTGSSDASIAIEDGRLVNVAVASNLMECGGVEYGPYPQEGNLLTLAENGSRLEVSDNGRIRVELVRVDRIPTRRVGETPTTGASPTNPPTTEPPTTDPP